MPFRPAGSDHAIVANSFAIALDAPVSDSLITSLKTRGAPWSDMLPATRDAANVELNIQSDGSPQIRRRSGVEHSFLKPDGNATWSLKIAGQEITVDCNLYTRWNKVWGQANVFLNQGMQLVAGQGPNRVTTFAMTVTDSFVTDTYSENAAAIFQSSSPLLASNLSAFDTLWHQHVGWLQADDDGELLQNLNIDVLPLDANDKSAGKQVNIFHLQRLTMSPQLVLSDASQANTDRLNGVASRMHRRNKEALAGLLSADVQSKIKLNGERG
jgi:hypothetical protein